MTNEEKILSLLEIVLTKVDNLEQGQATLEVIIENDIKTNINKLVDGHKLLNEKVDELKDLNEKVLNLQDDTHLHKIAIKELAKRTAK